MTQPEGRWVWLVVGRGGRGSKRLIRISGRADKLGGEAREAAEFLVDQNFTAQFSLGARVLLFSTKNVRPHTQITASIDNTSTLLAVPNPWSRSNRVS